MKKLLAFIFAVLPLFGLSFLRGEKSEIFEIPGIEKVCIVTKQNPAKQNALSTLGYNYVFVKPDEASSLSNEIETEGILLYISNDNLNKIQKSLNMLVFSTEEVEGKKIIQGYTEKYKDSITLRNKKVNVQIAVENGKMIVGFPMILSGF